MSIKNYIESESQSGQSPEGNEGQTPFPELSQNLYDGMKRLFTIGGIIASKGVILDLGFSESLPEIENKCIYGDHICIEAYPVNDAVRELLRNNGIPCHSQLRNLWIIPPNVIHVLVEVKDSSKPGIYEYGIIDRFRDDNDNGDIVDIFGDSFLRAVNNIIKESFPDKLLKDYGVSEIKYDRLIDRIRSQIFHDLTEDKDLDFRPLLFPIK